MTSEEKALELMEWLNTDDEEYTATLDKIKDMFDEHAAEAVVEQRSKKNEAEIAIGGWLSAALEDPWVCDQMKFDIVDWFAFLDIQEKEDD